MGLTCVLAGRRTVLPFFTGVIAVGTDGGKGADTDTILAATSIADGGASANAAKGERIDSTASAA
jgi:hypothetical protein